MKRFTYKFIFHQFELRLPQLEILKRKKKNN